MLSVIDRATKVSHFVDLSEMKNSSSEDDEDFERDQNLDESHSNVPLQELQKSATGSRKVGLISGSQAQANFMFADLAKEMAERQGSLIEASDGFNIPKKISLSNIIEVEGPESESYNAAKQNPFKSVSWSRTTHLPSTNNLFLDDNKLDTPSFMRASVDAVNPIARMKELKRVSPHTARNPGAMEVVSEIT